MGVMREASAVAGETVGVARAGGTAETAGEELEVETAGWMEALEFPVASVAAKLVG